MVQVSYKETFGPIPQSIPAVDLLTYTFDAQKQYDKTKKLYFDTNDDTKGLSAEDVENNVRKLVAGLKSAGVKKGDCIVLHLFNHYIYTCLFLGVIGTGAAFTGTNPSYTVFELSHRFKLCKPAVIITAPEHLANVQAAVNESLLSECKIFILDIAAEATFSSSPKTTLAVTAQNGHHEAERDIPSVSELLNKGSMDWMKISDLETAKDTIACMFSTSGTTGLPKVSQLSHYAIISQNLSVQSDGKSYAVSRLISLPFFNMFASGIVHMEPLRWGEPLYVMSRFDLVKYVSAIHKYGITDTATAPLMLIYMLKSGMPLKEKLGSLRYIWNGSAPVDSATLTEFLGVLSPHAMIAGIWGMSETGAQTAFKWFERDATGSVGRVVPGVEMKLIDEHGQQVRQDNIPGEAYVRSPQLMTSYVGNPSATDEIISDGWLRTGDICYVAEGKWFVIDRKKELIKVRGWQVAPAELEGVLVSHPQILDAAVVRVKLGDSEAPKGFILRAPGVKESDLTEEDVRAFMAEKLAKFKALDGGIVFVKAIPKNMTGKTVKKILLEME